MDRIKKKPNLLHFQQSMIVIEKFLKFLYKITDQNQHNSSL